VVELAEHAVEQVAQGGGVSVTVGSSAVVGSLGGPGRGRVVKAQRNPTALSRSFLIRRRLASTFRAAYSDLDPVVCGRFGGDCAVWV
jgi:hypothetical protein